MNKYSIIEVMQRRSSWRTYDVKSIISSKVLNELKEYISSKDHIGPFGNIARIELVKIPEEERRKLISDYGTYGFIKGAEYFIAGVIPSARKALEDFGYIFEHIILKATELNLGTCWLGGTLKRSTIAREVNLQTQEIIPAITPIGIPQKNRRVMGKIIRLAIRAKVRKPWEELFFTDNFKAVNPDTIEEPLSTALEMVRIAPSAKNKQPWRIICDSKNNIHFFIKINPRIGHVQNYQRIDIGIALSHFELAMRSFEKGGNWKISEPDFQYNPKLYRYVISWIEQGV